ncbi:ribonuclease P protein component [Oleiharenicola lentus]|uniref:ribonuclease P protein component n=1 Tax=Oleiharenicola lentus TaxID=2508720 RepID=UPI003F66920A
MRFGAGQRLRRNDDFRAVREQGRRMECGAFLLTWCHRPVDPAASSVGASRIGVVASRASVGNAVHRNLAKRRLRSLYRQHHALVPAGFDLVLTARPALLKMDYSEIAQRFAHACSKLSALPAKPRADA